MVLVLIAKSRMYTKRTAKQIAVTLTPFEVGSAPNIPKTPRTISRVHANAINDTTVAAAPASMKGFRFPQEILQLSLRIPTYGCTSVPDSGPAIHTKASKDLLIPRDSKYGCKKIRRLAAYLGLWALRIRSRAQPTTQSVALNAPVSFRSN